MDASLQLRSREEESEQRRGKGGAKQTIGNSIVRGEDSIARLEDGW